MKNRILVKKYSLGLISAIGDEEEFSAIHKELRDFFELALLRPVDYLLLGAVAVAWTLVLRAIWRARLFERLLSPEWTP